MNEARPENSISFAVFEDKTSQKLWVFLRVQWEVAQLAVHTFLMCASQAEGREFEPRLPLHFVI